MYFPPRDIQRVWPASASAPTAQDARRHDTEPSAQDEAPADGENEMSTTKEKSKRKPRKPKPLQKTIPGMEPPSIPELDRAIEQYQEAKLDRVALSNEETEKRNKVAALMAANQLNEYRFDGLLCTYQGGEPKVKVKKIDADEGQDLPPCPRCRTSAQVYIDGEGYCCRQCGGSFDDHPEEGGDYSDVNSARTV